MKAYKVWSGSSTEGMYKLVATFDEAIKSLASEETIKLINTHTIGISLIDCGKCHCGRLAELDILEQDGECLLCQKIRADASQDKYEEEDEDNNQDE